MDDYELQYSHKLNFKIYVQQLSGFVIISVRKDLRSAVLTTHLHALIMWNCIVKQTINQDEFNTLSCEEAPNIFQCELIPILHGETICNPIYYQEQCGALYL